LAGQFFPEKTLAIEANDSLKNSGVRCLMIGVYAGLAQPYGQLSEDYGSFGEVGGSMMFMNRSRLLFGLDGGFLFGSDVKKDPIPNLRNPDGSVSDGDGRDAIFRVFQRGTTVPGLRFGYVFPESRPFRKSNRLGGYSIAGGVSWLRHYTYIQELSKKTPQFSDQYRVGYDRLVTGPALGIWLGYLFLAHHNRINLQLEAGYLHGFTKTARYSFVDGEPAGVNRNDNLLQVKLKFFFSLRSIEENATYYY
jgi:hypothetical protein